MLAIVKSAANMRGPLLYNEQKVEQKQALFLEAHNFLPGKEELTMQKELETFQRLTQLNERSKQHAVHISRPRPIRKSVQQLHHALTRRERNQRGIFRHIHRGCCRLLCSKGLRGFLLCRVLR